MEWIIGLIAVIAALAGLVTSLAHGGYLYMLTSAARKRAGGEPVAGYAKSRYGVAAATSAAGLLALLLSSGGFFPDVLAILLGGGTAMYSTKALQASRERFRIGGSGH